MTTKKTINMMVVIMLSNTLLSIGAPGVPGSAIACSVAMKQTVKLDTANAGNNKSKQEAAQHE